MQPQLLWNAKMVIATVQRMLITTVLVYVRIPQQTHGLSEKVVDMHAASHVVSVRGISSTTIFRYEYLKKNRLLPYKWLLFKYYLFYSLEDKDAKHVFEILRNKSKREIKLIRKKRILLDVE